MDEFDMGMIRNFTLGCKKRFLTIPNRSCGFLNEKPGNPVTSHAKTARTGGNIRGDVDAIVSDPVNEDAGLAG